MRIHVSVEGWDDYQHWVTSDPATLARLNALIEDTRRTPFTGLGKPEPLKGDLAGWWSRRINREHRLIYRTAGKPGTDQRIEIAQCRYHY